MDTQQETKLNLLRSLWQEAKEIEQNCPNDWEREAKFEEWLAKTKGYFNHIFYNSKHKDDFLNAIDTKNDTFCNDYYSIVLNRAAGHIQSLGDSLKKGYAKDQFIGINNETSKNCFVAMSFDESRDDHYTLAIKPAIENNGYTPKRVDKDFHNEKIDTKILDDIEKSRFVVIDYTHQKNGVYYEAGYARGRGIPVIQCCDASDFDNLHFDIKSINTIKYTNITDLKTQLEEHIDKSIGSYLPSRNKQQIDIDEEIPF